MRFEFQPSIQYYLAATAVIAVSLAIHMQPEISQPLHADPPQAAQASGLTGRPAESLTLLESFPFRLVVLMVGASTVSHVAATFLNLQRLPRLAFGILAPVSCVALWHLFGNNPRYFSITEVLLFTVPFFAFGFVLVSFVFNFLFPVKP